MKKIHETQGSETISKPESDNVYTHLRTYKELKVVEFIKRKM